MLEGQDRSLTRSAGPAAEPASKVCMQSLVITFTK